MKYIVTILLCACSVIGCIPTQPEPPEEISSETEAVSTQDPQVAATQELITLFKEPELHRNSMRPYALCDQLAFMNPTALSPILELLGAQDTTPDTKIFILQAININMTEHYLPSIKALLDSTDPVTRSCATNLIGPIKTDEASQLLLSLKEDSSPAVAFSAWSGLAQHEMEPYRQEFIQYYTDPESNISRRSEIIRIILTNPKPQDVTTLSTIIIDPEITSGVRTAVAKILGEIGTPENIPPLLESLDLPVSEDYKTLAKSVVALIKERNQL